MIQSIYQQLLSFSITFLFLVGFCYNGSAQDNSDSLRVNLDPIKVTAIQSTISSADAPLSLSAYTRDLSSINESASLSLKSVGDQLPGLWINDRQNYALGERLTIRGIGWRAAFGVRGIQVVLNGIPLTVADGQTMINVVEPAFIRRAELVRGPAATYWGNSSGGVLYLSTTPSYQETSDVRIRTMAGSYGMRKAEAEWSISNPNHQMTAYSSYLKSNGFRDYSGVKMLRSGLTGSITLSSKSQLNYQAGAIYMPKAQHPSSLTKELAKENPTTARSSFQSAAAGKTITQGQAGLSYILDTSAGILNITGYGIYRDLSNPLSKNIGIITVNRWAGGLRTTLDKSWDNIDVQIGVESKLQNDDRIEFENAGNAQRGAVTVDQIERVWNQAVFATGTFSLGDFNISGGLRFDRLTFSTDTATAGQTGSRSFKSFSPSLGLSYNLDSQTLFANLSTSFEAPTTTELVNRPDGGNGFNPNLKPEQTIGLEVGARGSVAQQALRFDVAAYRLWITDLLFPYQLEANGPTFYRNQGETSHIGVEGRLSWQINNDWQLSSTANISKATFEKAEIEDANTTVSLNGNNVPGIPDVRINNNLQWSPGTFTGTLSYEYISGYTANNINTVSNDQYGIFNISLTYRTSLNDQSVKLQPFINIKNILDTRYNGSVVVNAFGGRYFEPAPGRNWQMGVSVDF